MKLLQRILKKKLVDIENPLDLETVRTKLNARFKRIKKKTEDEYDEIDKAFVAFLKERKKKDAWKKGKKIQNSMKIQKHSKEFIKKTEKSSAIQAIFSPTRTTAEDALIARAE